MSVEQITDITVRGMTCGNCVKHVTEELTTLAGVTAVNVDLVAGGDSPVSIVSTAPLDLTDIEAAVAEAGYTLAPVS